MTKIVDALPYIDPRASYPIGEASKLVLVCTKTLRKDATELLLIPYTVNPKTGRLRFRGKDLINYRTNIR
jgi:hypothetical protein